MKIAIIVQARTGSTRLPKKILLPWNNKTVLGEVLERCMATGLPVILAVPHQDLPLALFHEPCFVGHELDVLDRYYQAALIFEVSTIIRITADCPFTDPYTITKMIRLWDRGYYDYLSNCHPIRTMDKGFDVEIFSFQTLKKTWQETPPQKHFREHVTTYMYESGLFRLGTYRPENHIMSNENFSIDTFDDYIKLREMTNGTTYRSGTECFDRSLRCPA